MPRKAQAETNAPTTTDAQPAGDSALRAQLDQVLDMLIEQQDEIKALKGAQTGTAATSVQQNDKQAELDAELSQLTEEFKDYPLIGVFERRALVGMDANQDIRLKGEPPITVDPDGAQRTWKLRWFNFGKDGRAQQATSEGYEKVRWDDLQDQESVATGQRIDEYVRTGQRGEEVLCKMPLKLYVYKKKRDAARRSGLLSSESKMRDHIANRVAARAGSIGDNADQAGSFVHRGVTMTLTPGEPESFTP